MVAHTLVNSHNRMVVEIFVLLRDPAALGNSSENLEQFKTTSVSISNCHYRFEWKVSHMQQLIFFGSFHRSSSGSGLPHPQLWIHSWQKSAVKGKCSYLLIWVALSSHCLKGKANLLSSYISVIFPMVCKQHAKCMRRTKGFYKELQNNWAWPEWKCKI